MRSIRVGVVVALTTFSIGVVATSLWIVRDHRSAENLPSVHAVAMSQMWNHPEGWQKIEGDNRFSFYLPPDMEQDEDSVGCPLGLEEPSGISLSGSAMLISLGIYVNMFMGEGHRVNH